MTAYRQRDDHSALTLPLRSEPPWLRLGILGLMVASSAVFVWIFSLTRFSAALGLMPAMTVTVFGASVMSAVARRRGGSLSLELVGNRAVLHEPDSQLEVLDLDSRFSAALLVDATSRRRMLVLGQHGDPIVLLEPHSNAVPASPLWRTRTRVLDLGAILLSPASAHVVTLADGVSLDPLLARIEPLLTEGLPWFSYPISTGEILRVEAAEVCLGRLAVAQPESLRSTAHAVQIKGGTVAGLGFSDPDATMILLACDDAPVPEGAPAFERSPDAYLPHTVFEVIRAISHPSARTSEPATT